jgi:Ca-activated chloride channel family protein
MLAMDLSPNRLEAAKQVAAEFVNGRPNDNIGLTIFAGESFTQCPLTVDHAVLLNMLNSVKCDIVSQGIIEDGTAIGMGIANAVSRLKESKAKSKVIILLTDGDQTDGSLSLPKAIDLAEKEGVKIYTIGVGLYDSLFGGFMKLSRSSIDEKSLKEIADKTKGSYFRAKDMYSLKKVYKKIDELEPQSSQGNIIQEKDELFYIPLAIALILSVFLLFIPRSYFK